MAGRERTGDGKRTDHPRTADRGERSTSPSAEFSKEAFRSLLVPVDLSPLSDRVIGRSIMLPIAAGGTVTLLHVVPENLPLGARRLAVKEARTALVAEALHAAKALRRDVSVEHTVSVGVPAAEIARTAAQVKADLIVTGRGIGRPLRDSFLGSTAERVIRQGPTPVLVVRLPARPPYRRPALGLALDQAAEAVVAMVLRVLPSPRPRVTIIHGHDRPYLRMAYAQLSEDEIAQAEQEYRRGAVPQLAQIVGHALHAAKRPPDDGAGFKTHVRHGDPRTVIKAAVKKLDADLLVLGTRGHSGLAHVFLGTVAGEILRDVRCDVLVVPPPTRNSRRG